MSLIRIITILLIYVHGGGNECIIEKKTYTSPELEEICSSIKCYYDFKTEIISARCECSLTTLEEINSYISDIYVKTYVSIKNTTFEILEPKYDWKYVTELNMERTNISKIIPGYFSGLSNLQTLTIIDGNLTEISGNILSPLSSLEIIDLSNNKLLNLDVDSFSALHKLKSITISKNQLSSFLTKEVFKYHKVLETIDFSQNYIKNITAFENADSVKSVNVSHNFLSFIGDNFSSISLQNLDLSFNNISNISVNAFCKSTLLEKLDISHNFLKELPVGGFTTLEKLLILDLSNNKINCLKFGTFTGLSALHRLDLSNNRISFNIHTLTTLVSLIELNISRNLYTNLDVIFIVNHFTHLRRLSIDNTNWNCFTLTTVIHELHKRNIYVPSGEYKNSSNINGIKCTESIDTESKNLESTYNNNNDIDKDNFNNFQKTEFFQFFNKDFQNTNFYKFLNNFLIRNVSNWTNNKENQNTAAKMEFYVLQNISHNVREIAGKINSNLGKNNPKIISPQITDISTLNDSLVVSIKQLLQNFEYQKDLIKTFVKENKNMTILFESIIEDKNNIKKDITNVISISICCLIFAGCGVGLILYKMFFEGRRFSNRTDDVPLA